MKDFCGFFTFVERHKPYFGNAREIGNLRGIIVTGMSYWLRIWCIEKKGPVFIALFTPLALVITVIFSTFVWKEILHWGSVGGAILLVGGLYSVLWGKRKEEDVETCGTNEARQNVTKEETGLECITHQ